MASPPRPRLSRSPSWPSSLRLATNVSKSDHSSASESGSVSATTTTKSKDFAIFAAEDDSEDHPEDHFLSPMHEYEFWASDSDDDEDQDEVEWDAGIMDFALFNSERRRTQESHEQLDGRWTGLIQSQQSALSRAVQRSRTQEPIVDTSRPPLPFAEEVPGLTPDASPRLNDDLDPESPPPSPGQEQRPSAQTSPKASTTPDYLTITLTPPSPTERAFDSDEDLPLSFSLHRRSQSTKPERRRFERPGLRHSRTMSGRAHSWRRPGWELYSLREDPEAEKRAEAVGVEKVVEQRGRRGSDGW